MKNNVLYLFILILKVYYAFSQQVLTHQQQCDKLKLFYKDNGFQFTEENDNCCNLKQFIVCNNKTNTISQVIIEPKLNEGLNYRILDFKNYPVLPEIEDIVLSKVAADESGVLPSILFQPKIKYVRIFNSNYTTVNKEIENLQNLEKLFIRACHLKEFPYQLKNLNSLEIINVSNNQIEGPIKSEIKNFVALKQLGLASNNIKEFMNIPPNLERLELEDAKVTSIDINILKNLTYLGLKSNPIKNVDNIFEEINNNLKKLGILNLSNDNVSIIPKSIKNLTNLKSLYLEGNKIMVIPDELYSLSLDVIYLNGNSDLMGSFNFNNNAKNCTIKDTNICFQNENVCTQVDIKPNICTEKELNEIKKLQEERYKIFENQQEKLKKINKEEEEESFFEKNKLIIISLIIAVVLLLIFIIYFFVNNKNKNQPVFVKDENNATYAYNNNEKSRQYINELNLSNSDIKEKELKINDSIIENKNVSNNYEKNLNENISQPENIYITNFNGNNNGNNNVLISPQLSSQLSPQLSPQLSGNGNIGNINSNSQLSSQYVGNINGSVLVSQLNPQLIDNNGISNLNQPLSPQLINNINGTGFIPQLSPQISGNNGISSSNPQLGLQSLNNGGNQLNNVNLMNISLMASSSNQSNNINSSNNLDNDQIRLQAKIQKEMLLAEEMLINKKAKDNNKKDNNDDQLPPYSQL